MVEKTLIKWLSSGLQIPTSHNIPKRYPAKFLTVERQGGAFSNRIERALIGVQVWSKTSEQACELAYVVAKFLTESEPPQEIRSVKVDGIYEFRAEQDEMGRYQLNIEIIANIGE